MIDLIASSLPGIGKLINSGSELVSIIATIGIIVAIFAALFGLIWFPVKRLLKKRKEKKEQKNKVD